MNDGPKRFDDMPTEVRLLIWRSMFPDPREVNLVTLPEFPYAQHAMIPPAQLPPTTLSVNSESRAETLRHYVIVHHEDQWRRGQRQPLIFDKSRDLVVLPITRASDEALEQFKTVGRKIQGGFGVIKNMELRDTCGSKWSAHHIHAFTKAIIRRCVSLSSLKLLSSRARGPLQGVPPQSLEERRQIEAQFKKWHRNKHEAEEKKGRNFSIPRITVLDTSPAQHELGSVNAKQGQQTQFDSNDLQHMVDGRVLLGDEWLYGASFLYRYDLPGGMERLLLSPVNEDGCGCGDSICFRRYRLDRVRL